MKILTRFLLLCILTVSARAESVTLQNQQADELLGSLMSIEDGLSVSNTTIAADNINSLRPKSEAFGKGNQVAAKKHGIGTKVTKTDDPEYLVYLDDISANREMLVTVDLLPMELTPEEITNMKVKAGTSKPAILSVLKLYLKPKAKK